MADAEMLPRCEQALCRDIYESRTAVACLTCSRVYCSEACRESDAAAHGKACDLQSRLMVHMQRLRDAILLSDRQHRRSTDQCMVIKAFYDAVDNIMEPFDCSLHSHAVIADKSLDQPTAKTLPVQHMLFSQSQERVSSMALPFHTDVYTVDRLS